MLVLYLYISRRGIFAFMIIFALYPFVDSASLILLNEKNLQTAIATTHDGFIGIRLWIITIVALIPAMNSMIAYFFTKEDGKGFQQTNHLDILKLVRSPSSVI